jgi:ABC-type branched-subunit amino acid transport system ATPase component/ABC-type branched-subunit amino acid transport system permease subunit
VRPSRRAVRTLILLAVLAVLPPVLGRAAPGLLSDTRALQIGIAVCTAAAALSLNVLMGYAGQISLGHGAFVGIGAFASGIITSRGPQAPFIVGLLLAAVAGAVFAFVLGLPALRLRGLHLAIVTAGFAFMMEYSLFRWQPLTGGSSGVELPRPRAGTFVFLENADYLAVLLVLLLGIWVIDRNLLGSKLGRAFLAIRWDEPVAQSFGINVARYKLMAFVIAGALGGIAGSMYGHLIIFASSVSFNFNFSLLLVIIVVVGGLGSRTGVLIAGILFAFMPRALSWLEGWDLLIGPLLLIDVVVRNPKGLGAAMRERALTRRHKKAGVKATVHEPSMPKLPSMPRPHGLPERPQVLAGTPLLEVRDVSVRFGGLQALDAASLTVPKGKIVGLIGPNGAGKTTFFNAVSGVVSPDRGTVRFMGADITNRPPHERVGLGIGRTFQLIGLAKDLTVRDNFLLAQHLLAGYGMAAALLALPRASRVERDLAERADQAIEALGFERFRDTPVSSLSHGQQRIVELGCALVTAPDLLLLDEPSAGMSPAAAESLAERLRDIRDELGRTVLLIEHNIPLVLDVCDEISVLNFGQILAAGTTEEIARDPLVLGAYFGEAVPA